MSAEPVMKKMTYREACKQGIRAAMNRDEKAFLMGADVGRYGGCFAVSKGLLEEYGEERIRDMPLSESAIAGIGMGVCHGRDAPDRGNHDRELQPARPGPDPEHRLAPCCICLAASSTSRS